MITWWVRGRGPSLLRDGPGVPSAVVCGELVRWTRLVPVEATGQDLLILHCVHHEEADPVADKPQAHRVGDQPEGSQGGQASDHGSN